MVRNSSSKNKRQKLESKEEKEDRIDRLSLLPDSILTDILSLVPLHSAVSTSVLSRRWRNLWTQVTHLSFDAFQKPFFSVRDRWKSYLEIVNHLFPQLTSPKIHSLCLVMPYGFNIDDDTHQALCSSLESWITSVCSRHVERIEVIVSGCSIDELSFTMPSCVFQCQSLAILKLKGITFTHHFNEGLVVSLPNLKKLDLELLVLDSQFLAQLLMFCPLLEQFTLLARQLEGHHSVDLSIISLKNLCIKLSPSVTNQGSFIINASKLERITLDRLCLGSLSIVKPSGSLVTADVSLSLENESMDAIGYHTNTLRFAEMISSATSIHLNFTACKALSDLREGLLPTFENLSDLNINFNHLPGSWCDLLGFLTCTPNLANLTLRRLSDMKGPVPNYAPPCGFAKLRTIYIDHFQGNKDDVEMIKYVMSCANLLKLLSIRVSIPTRRKDTMLWREYDLCQTLFLLQRPSTCELELSGCYITVSGKGFQKGNPHCQKMRLGQLVL